MQRASRLSCSRVSCRLVALIFSSNWIRTHTFASVPLSSAPPHRTSRGLQMNAIPTDHPLQTADPSMGVVWEAPPSVKVVLGSQSFTRKLLLREMGVNFECVPANIDEKQIRRDKPQELVQALADAKAEALLRHPEVIARSSKEETLLLVTSDQVVVHDGDIREKPESKDEARAFIRGYGKSPASTVGAIAVTNLKSGKRVMELDTATIHFKPIPEEVIEQVVAQDMVLKCAGGLMVEDPLVQPYLVRIEGGMDSVMGLGKRVMHKLLCSALEP